MKKIALLVALLSCFILFSFIKSNHSVAIHKTTPKKALTQAEKFACAAPTNLNATRTSSTTVALSWTSGPGVSWQPGGYINCNCPYPQPTTQPFSYSTTTYPYSINVPPSTYSITFRVTVTCIDGSTATSAPFSKTL